jgi:hypothetical protein
MPVIIHPRETERQNFSARPAARVGTGGFPQVSPHVRGMTGAVRNVMSRHDIPFADMVYRMWKIFGWSSLLLTLIRFS